MKKAISLILAMSLTFSLVLPKTISADLEKQFIDRYKIVGENNELKRIIVEIEPDASRNDVLQAINQLQDANLRRQFNHVINGFSFEIPSSQIAAISNIKGVKFVKEAQTYKPLAYKSQVLTQSLLAKQTYANKGEGMVIAIVDTGIDPKHKDMLTIKDISKAKLSVSGESSDFTLKVPYGYNFADNSYNFKDDNEKTMHGMHVAGIAAASGEYDENNPNASIEGVAPEAQLLAMKVFTNSPANKLAYDDDILAAIEKSIELKADIINLSLGTPNGFVDAESPVQKAINYAQEQGILVVAAAGNEATAFGEDDGTSTAKNTIEKDRVDFGVVGSPSIADGALSVASYENEIVLKNTGLLKTATSELFKISFVPSAGEIDETERALVYANLGEESDYTSLDVFDKFVLVERGKITFSEKVNNAINRGAKGIIVFNNQEGTVNMDLTNATPGLVIGISQKDGQKLVELLQNNADAVLALNATQEYVQSDEANTMSSFTSWGTTNTLDFKPEISGVGGNVLSTLNDNQYKYDSGTSMAAPHVSGASAIIYSQLKKDLPTVKNYAEFTKKTILNTAKVLVTSNNIPYTPRRQGAGLIQTKAAIENRVLATFEKEDGEAVGELRDFRGIKNFKVVLKNYGTTAQTFKVQPNFVQTTKLIKNQQVTEIMEQQSIAVLSANVNSIVLGPNETKEVMFSLNAEGVEDEYVEGFITFKSTQASQPDLTFAYLGFAGDWNKEAIFDPIYSAENKDTVDKVYGFTRLITQLGEVYVPAGISANSGSRAAYSYENAAISPNEDTAADVILPQFATLRNVARLEFNILDANKNVIRHLVDERKIAKTTVKQFKANVAVNEQFLVPAYLNARWDGKVYDAQTGTLKNVADGTYYYQVKAYLRDSDVPQTLEYKVQVDTKKPVVEIKSLTQAESGLKIRFTVEDNLALVYRYARLNTTGDEITAEEVEPNTYEVVLPNTAINDNLVELIVKDAAYNETVVKVDQASTARFISGTQNQLIEEENGKALLNLRLKDEQTTKVRVIYQSTVNETQVVDEAEVSNQEVSLMTSLPEEGRYQTIVEELKGAEVIARVMLDSVIYDYHAPQISDIRAMNDGNIQASVVDNIFAVDELLYFINDELVTPTFNGNRITIKKENPTTGDRLTVAHSKQKQKGLSSFVVLDYINVPTLPPLPPLPPPPPPLPPLIGGFSKKINLTFNNFLSAGIKDLKTDSNPNGTIIEREGKFYYIVKGFTNDVWSSVFVGEKLAEIDFQKSEFTAEVEIKEGINTINVIAKDYTNKIFFEGNVKLFFDKQLPVLNWNQNLQFEVDEEQDKVYIVIDEKNEDILLSGSLADQGFGYGLEINGDYVISKTDISKQLSYDVPFTKLIKVKPNDIVTVVVVDAVGNKQEFKYHIKALKIYDDLEIKKESDLDLGDKVSFDDLIKEILGGYKVHFKEDVSKMTEGSHKANLVVTYPNNKKKSFEVKLNIGGSKEKGSKDKDNTLKEKEVTTYRDNDVLVQTKEFTQVVKLKADLIKSEANSDIFSLVFLDSTNQKVEGSSGKYRITLPKRHGKKVVGVNFLENVEVSGKGEREVSAEKSGKDANKDAGKGENKATNLEIFEFIQDDKTVTFTVYDFSKDARFLVQYENDLDGSNGKNEILAKTEGPSDVGKESTKGQVSLGQNWLLIGLSALLISLLGILAASLWVAKKKKNNQ